MSILLDALKKSEAQRRLGETPTLQTSVSLDEGRSADRQQWIPFALILLSAGIMTWTGIAQFRGDDSQPTPAKHDAESAGVVATQPDTVTVPAPGAAEQSKARPARARDHTQARNAATTPVKDYVVDDPPPDSRVSSPANRAGEDPDTTSARFADEPDAAGSGVSGIKPASEPSRRVAHVEIDAKPPVELTTGSPEGIAAAEPASSQPGKAGQEAFAPQTISYWQVPQSLREEMGEFRITVLVYSENPADRFLLVNGSRLREQEETEGGVRLEAIERDRAVFSYRSYRFHLQN